MRAGSKRFSLGAVALVAALLAGSAVAGAQEDPYGSTTTTRSLPRTDPSCDLSVTSGTPGTAVTATVSGLPAGATVRVVFDGSEVGRGTVDADAGGAEGSVAIDFRVPVRPPGRYGIAAVGADVTVVCGADDGGQFSVLAAAQGQGRAPLPRTGIYVGLLVVVAGALLLFGRGLVSASRRGRRTHGSRAGRHRAGV